MDDESHSNWNFFPVFLICLLICLGGGWLNGLSTEASIENWYPRLYKPSWTPPNITFPIVWTILYALMALSLALVWTSRTSGKKLAITFFAIQLFLNFLWSWLFFYFKKPGYALVDVILLWFAIAITIDLFWKHSRWGACILIPYLVWVSFAFYLNLYIWSHN